MCARCRPLPEESTLRASVAYLLYMYGEGFSNPPNIIPSPNVAEAITIIYAAIFNMEKSRRERAHK